MKLLLSLIKFNNLYYGAFKSPRIIHVFICIQVLQLASLITTLNDLQSTYHNRMLRSFFQIISKTSIVAWNSIGPTDEIPIIFCSYLIIYNFLQLTTVFLAYKDKAGESTRLIVLFYKLLGMLFEYVLFIPMLSWVFFTRVPSIGYLSAEISSTFLDKSPQWLYFLTIILLLIATMFHFAGKFADVCFSKYPEQDKLTTRSFIFDLQKLLMTICLVILTSKATNFQIASFWPALVGCLQPIINVTLDLCYLGYKVPSAKLFHLFLMACYFVHSLLILISIELKSHHEGATMSANFFKFFGIIYFISIPLFAKLCVSLICNISRLPMQTLALFQKSASIGKGLSSISQNKKFEEMLWLLYERNDQATTLSNRKMFISSHIGACKNDLCFCFNEKWEALRFDVDLVDSNQEDVETPTSPVSLASLQIEFIEAAYEELLKATQGLYLRQNLWALIDLVLYQALYLERPLKACITLEKFKGSYFSFYERHIHAALGLFLYDFFLHSLGTAERSLFKVKFLDGLELDLILQDILHRFQNIKQLMIDFYQHLGEASLVDLNFLYNKGRSFIDNSTSLETLLEQQLLKGSVNPQILALLIDFKLSILGGNKYSVKTLQNKLQVSLLSKKANINNFFTTSNQSSIDFLSNNNVFLAVDLAINPGEIIAHNSKLFVDLGYSYEESKLSLRQILPLPVFKHVELSLNKLLTVNQSSLEIGKIPLDLIFLAHTRGYLIPYEGYAKVEFTETSQRIQGAVAIKKIESDSDYILTEASGEIISGTHNALSMLGIDFIEEMKGLNICVLIPNLSKYYLDIPEHDEELYPIQKQESGKFNAIVYWKENAVQRKAMQKQMEETNELLLELSQRGKSERKDSASPSGKNIQLFHAEVFGKAPKRFLVSLKVRKYEIENNRFKVIEILSCTKLSDGLIKLNSSEGFFSSDNDPSVIVFPKFKSDVIEEPVELNVPREGGTNASKLVSGNAGDLKDKEYLKSTLMNLCSSQKEYDEPIQPILAYRSANLTESSKEGECSKGQIRSRSNHINLQLELHKTKTAAISSGGSSKASTQASYTLKSMLQANLNYRVLQMNFVMGLLGVALIIALFTAQYVGYKQRLDELGLLCTSLKYPILIGLNLQMLAKEYYKWELAMNNQINITSWFDEMTKTINFPAYIDLTTTHQMEVLEGVDISPEISKYLSKWDNSVQMRYSDGQTVNMSLTLAVLLQIQAGRQYFSDQVLNSQEHERSLRNGFLLENNTNLLYDQLLDMNNHLYHEIEKRIDNILNFNVILIIVVSLTIAVLAASCIIMYKRINTKKLRMLTMLLTIQKSDLKKEYHSISNVGKKKHDQNKSEKLRQRVVSNYVYRNSYEYLKYFGMFIVFAVFLMPFILVFDQKKLQIEATLSGVQNIDVCVQFEAHLASVFAQEFNYFRHLNSSSVVREAINARKEQELTASLVQYSLFQDFMTNFGHLPNQDTYESEVSQKIFDGLSNVCESLDQTDFFVEACKTCNNGIGDLGIIEAINSLHQEGNFNYRKIVNASSAEQARNVLTRTTAVIETDFLQVSVNRYLRQITILMTTNFVNFMQNISKEAFDTFIAIALIILLILGVGWAAWIRTLQKTLNDTKDIYRILPTHILENSKLIKNYFKKEFQQSFKFH